MHLFGYSNEPTFFLKIFGAKQNIFFLPQKISSEFKIFGTKNALQ